MIRQLVARFAAGLRFPTLFMICAGLFLVDLIVPDVIPFAEEILLALLTLLIGSIKKRGPASPDGKVG